MSFTVNDINAYYPLDKVLGGRIGFTQVISGQGGNLVPLALPSDLSGGRTVYRKMGFRVDDSNNGVGVESFIRLWKKLASEAYRCWMPVSSRMLNSEITGSEEKYGTATLKYAIISTDTSMVVTVKNVAHATGNDAIFNDGKLLSVCGASQTPTVDPGLQSYVVVSGAPGVDTLDITMTLAAAIGADYAAGSLVQSFPDKIDTETSYENVDVTSTSGVFFDTQIALDNIGTPTLSVTITFTSATTFSATGDWEGIVAIGTSSLGTGSTAASFAPVNLFNSRSIFTLPAGIFTGTWEAGDTVEFDINGAEYAFFIKHIIPPGTTSIAGDSDDVYCQMASVG